MSNTNNQTSVVLNFSTITILSGGYIKGGNITIYTNNLTVNSGGKIDVSGLGYQGGVSALSVCKGIGPGAEAAGSQSGSAGYGGLGGVGFNGGFGLPYGSFLNPNEAKAIISEHPVYSAGMSAAAFSGIFGAWHRSDPFVSPRRRGHPPRIHPAYRTLGSAVPCDCPHTSGTRRFIQALPRLEAGGFCGDVP